MALEEKSEFQAGNLQEGMSSEKVRNKRKQKRRKRTKDREGRGGSPAPGSSEVWEGSGGFDPSREPLLALPPNTTPK